MKPHQLRPATTGHFSLLTSATSWTGARRLRIQKQKVERGIVPQVFGISNEWAANVKVRGCPYITSAAITRQGQSECL